MVAARRCRAAEVDRRDRAHAEQVHDEEDRKDGVGAGARGDAGGRGLERRRLGRQRFHRPARLPNEAIFTQHPAVGVNCNPGGRLLELSASLGHAQLRGAMLVVPRRHHVGHPAATPLRPPPPRRFRATSRSSSAPILTDVIAADAALAEIQRWLFAGASLIFLLLVNVLDAAALPYGDSWAAAAASRRRPLGQGEVLQRETVRFLADESERRQVLHGHIWRPPRASPAASATAVRTLGPSLSGYNAWARQPALFIGFLATIPRSPHLGRPDRDSDAGQWAGRRAGSRGRRVPSPPA